MIKILLTAHVQKSRDLDTNGLTCLTPDISFDMTSMALKKSSLCVYIIYILSIYHIFSPRVVIKSKYN